MNLNGTQTLETNRLILRKFKIEDTENVFKNYASSDLVTKYMTWETHSSIEVTRQYLENLIENYKNNEFFDWSIVLKSTNEVIGSIGAKKLDKIISKVEVGYCIGEKWWNQGIVTEALKRVISFLFDEVGVNRIEAFHDIRNLVSGKVMQKCGMKFEGFLRQAYKFKNGLSDVLLYSILREDKSCI